MSEELKIKSLIVGNHILALAGLIFGNWNFLWLTLIGWILFGKIGGEIGFHRYFAHKSFITKKWKENILIFLGVFNGFVLEIYLKNNFPIVTPKYLYQNGTVILPKYKSINLEQCFNI